MKIFCLILWFLMLALVVEVSIKRRRMYPFDVFWFLSLVMSGGMLVISIIVGIGSMVGLPR